MNCAHNFEGSRRCRKCGAWAPEDHPSEVNRSNRLAHAVANDLAVLRECAKNWGPAEVGRHMRAVLAAIDGAAPLTAEMRDEIRHRGYHTGPHGDSMGDYMNALLFELHKRETR